MLSINSGPADKLSISLDDADPNTHQRVGIFHITPWACPIETRIATWPKSASQLREIAKIFIAAADESDTKTHTAKNEIDQILDQIKIKNDLIIEQTCQFELNRQRAEALTDEVDALRAHYAILMRGDKLPGGNRRGD